LGDFSILEAGPDELKNLLLSIGESLRTFPSRGWLSALLGGSLHVSLEIKDQLRRHYLRMKSACKSMKVPRASS
jgi:hypothetical protein